VWHSTTSFPPGRSLAKLVQQILETLTDDETWSYSDALATSYCAQA
jgi:hypothetical protein